MASGLGVDTFARRTPHYLRIYRDLKDQLEAGQLAPGERLPAQRALAEEYGVTVMTVRQALLLLEQEQLVVTRHGLGTFAAPRRVEYAMGNLRSLAQEVTDQGLALKTRVLRRALVQPHPRVAELLQVGEGERVCAIERLRLVASQPIVYQHSQLPAPLGRALRTADLRRMSLYDCLRQKLHVELSRAQEWIRAVDLAPQEARLLEEEPGAAALLSERLTFASTGEPIMFDRALMRSDRVSVATERLVSDVSVGYQLRLAKEAE